MTQGRPGQSGQLRLKDLPFQDLSSVEGGVVGITEKLGLDICSLYPLQELEAIASPHP